MTYSELYPDSIINGQGLITTLRDIDGIPWKKLSAQLVQDIERAFYLHSGFKTVLVSWAGLTSGNRARLIASIFSEKWSKLWKDYNIEYDPLHAYLVEETGNRHRETDDTHTENFGRVVNTKTTDEGSVTTTGNEESTSGIYGFNSADSVNGNKSNGNSTDTENRNLNGSSDTTNSGSDVKVIDGDEKENYSSTKRGNIGYSTPQKLLREDLELWAKPFFMTVFQDIDSYIMCQVYTI